MSKKRTPSAKQGLDLPPVPSSTRYVETTEASPCPHLECWISDLIGFDYQEVTLPVEQQKISRFFKQEQKKLAIHLTDSMYIPNYNRPSATNLSVLDDGIYITIHLAIASSETSKIAAKELQNTLRSGSDSELTQILTRLLKQQSPIQILESFRYEQFIVQEILGATDWSKSLFTALLMELQPPAQLLAPWQQALILDREPDAFDKRASRTFISMFASRELAQSAPQLSNYSKQIISAGLTVPAQNLKKWADTVVNEWCELSLREATESSALYAEEAERVSYWLARTISEIAANNMAAA